METQCYRCEHTIHRYISAYIQECRRLGQWDLRLRIVILARDHSNLGVHRTSTVLNLVYRHRLCATLRKIQRAEWWNGDAEEGAEGYCQGVVKKR